MPCVFVLEEQNCKGKENVTSPSKKTVLKEIYGFECH